MPPKPLTLIVAATKRNGIGYGGQLPWPPLKQEMGYFARVTKRIIPPGPASAPLNAVIMGRKTWDSIPLKFRPLKDRLNVVVTRAGKLPDVSPDLAAEGPLVAGSFEEALQKLDELDEAILGRIFVIGGATMYDEALKHGHAKRVLLTRIESEFECDTFFPVDLEADAKWEKRSLVELEQFTGEDFQSKIEWEEKGVRWRFELFERV